jgi:predicted DNA-binding protein (UPF0251 family)
MACKANVGHRISRRHGSRARGRPATHQDPANRSVRSQSSDRAGQTRHAILAHRARAPAQRREARRWTLAFAIGRSDCGPCNPTSFEREINIAIDRLVAHGERLARVAALHLRDEIPLNQIAVREGVSRKTVFEDWAKARKLMISALRDDLSLPPPATDKRHSRECGHSFLMWRLWIPAGAGMTTPQHFN